MDLIDKKILCALDENCRQPISKIAHDLRIGRNVASYRIKKMEEEGIIANYICSINLGKFGYKTYKIYFKINSKENAVEKKFVEFLKNEHRVIHLLKTEGSFEYSIALSVKTISELDQFLTELKSSFSEILTDYFVSIIVYSKIFKMNKLLLDEKAKSVKFEGYSGEEKLTKIDEVDKRILGLLAQRSNLSILEISEKANISIDVAKYRLKKLTSNTINSFRALFDLGRLGYYHYVLMIKMRKAKKEDEDNIMRWCSNKKNVLYFTKRIGHFDFEINAAITDIKDLNNFIDEFKDKFSNLMDSYELIINGRLLKLNYVPFR